MRSAPLHRKPRNRTQPVSRASAISALALARIKRPDPAASAVASHAGGDFASRAAMSVSVPCPTQKQNSMRDTATSISSDSGVRSGGISAKASAIATTESSGSSLASSAAVRTGSGSAATGSMEGAITAPGTAAPGATRLRLPGFMDDANPRKRFRTRREGWCRRFLLRCREPTPVHAARRLLRANNPAPLSGLR